jgi:GntR family transcriptional regulator / MocR family aminotransferase
VEWGVSRTTVKAVYAQLAAEGYLATRPGAYTTVAYGLEEAVAPLSKNANAAPRCVSSFAARLRAFPWLVMPQNVGVADFRYGDLSAADFPVLAWRRALNKAMVRARPWLRYDSPQGYAPLRAALQGYLWRARGISATAEQIIIVNGSQQGLDICARLLLDPGDRFIMENPGYGLARQAFEATGGVSIPVAVDDEGMQTASLPPARLAYVTPSHQFPLGGVLSATRRRALLAWAVHNRAYILEDDYDGEYRHGVAPIAPLQTIDPESVIYIGTFSKTLSPTLRLGYVVAPTALCSDFAGAKRIMDRHSPLYEQEALAGLLETGAYERHVRSIRRKNAHRRGVLLKSLVDTLGDSVGIAGADTGLHIVVWIKGVPAEREADIVAEAQSHGIGLYKVSPHFDRSAPPAAMAGVVLGYAALEDAALRKGVAVLAKVIARYR